MALQWKNATVVEKKIWAPGLFTLRLNAPDVLPFEPGQFLQLGKQVDGHHVNRPYSVASPHAQELEFYIVLVEDGKLTPVLWKAEPGDSIDISDKAAGSFTLSKAPAGKHLWLISTGTGLAPYIAMLRTQTPWQRFEKIVVVHGVRYMTDLSYVDELKAFETAYPGRFTYLPVVSRESHPHGLSGRITHCLEQGSLEEKAGERLCPEHSVILLCGNPAMLDELEALLAIRNIQRHKRSQPGQIVVERYW
jgi:ferredoxin/flavodoxin---NADP+ reductase